MKKKKQLPWILRLFRRSLPI